MLVQLDDSDARSQAAHAQAALKGAQADVQAVSTGWIAGRSADPANSDRESSHRSRFRRNAALDAFKRLQEKGAASLGEVKEAENNLQRAQADL